MITRKTTLKTQQSLEKISGKKLTLGNVLWSIREGEALTQVEMAKTLGISSQYLCDIEHGRRHVSPKSAAAYANKLGYSEEQFIRLSLQDILNKDGFNLEVDVRSFSKPNYAI